MVETVMAFCGGFLLATLWALILMSLVHRRAIRLTERRLHDQIPKSIMGLMAERDNQRASFAVSTRRLELAIEHLKEKSTTQQIEIGLKSEMIGHLRSEAAARIAEIRELAARSRLASERVASERIPSEENTIAMPGEAVAAAATRNTDGAGTRAPVRERATIAGTPPNDAERLEIAILQTQITQFEMGIEGLRQQAGAALREPSGLAAGRERNAAHLNH